MLVLPPPTQGQVDVFIDNLINVFLDTIANWAKQPHVVPLAAFVTNISHVGNNQELVPRQTILSILKLIAEGTLAEIQIVLGWLLNTRQLIVALQDHKFLAWTTDIRAIIQARKVCHNELESLIGYFNHAAVIMPIFWHFFG